MKTLAINLLALIIVICIGLASLLGIFYICKSMSVWSASITGQAELKQADWNRQITVREAQAKKDAATLLAEAEVERAKGVAQANKIIGDSLKNNEEYLRYLWIDSLDKTQNQIVYVPTEANLPILEANRFRNKS